LPVNCSQAKCTDRTVTLSMALKKRSQAACSMAAAGSWSATICRK
jgi:hypothetical protein